MANPRAAATEHIGETQAMKNHDHDLVHELNKELDSVWRYDQYIANAGDKEELKKFWQQQKQRSETAVELLRGLIAREVQNDCF